MAQTRSGPVPEHGRGRSGGPAWTVFSLLGIGGWIGVTVYVAATNPDPSDPTPILRTFAVAGAVFFAVVLAAAAVGMRRAATVLDQALYLRLAGSGVTRETLADVARRTRRFGPVYLGYAGATTALMLTTIGLGEQGPYRILIAVLAGLVLAWLVTAAFALRSVFRGTDQVLAPLGLAVVEIPVMPAGRLAGRLSYRGVRHGRQVTIVQTPGRSVTTVGGTLPRRSLTSATTMASMTGLPARVWRRVTAVAGGEGVTVRRSGNGAGRWLLHDLLLAEHLTGACSPPDRTAR
jgi:hypothetical protein